MKNYLLATCIFFLSACSTIYYTTWEFVGIEKRDLLKSEIEASQDDQEDLEEAFSDALEKIRANYSIQADELEDFYDELSAEQKTVINRTKQLENRISDIEKLGRDLFEEWQEEAQTISNQSYRRDSLKKRTLTMKQFNQMLTKMKRVENSIDPLLVKMNDQVLYLKHNLNAKAVGVLRTELVGIGREIEVLIEKVRTSNKESERFIASLN